MIEVIYKNNNTELKEPVSFKLPKNIRQIGDGESDYQIYIEDYLMSYLKKRPERDGDIRYGVLLGDVKVGNGYTYFFINGAVDVEDVMENTLIFNDEIWTGLYDDINTYFAGNRIVGWFAALNDMSNNDMVNIKKLHLDNFAGLDKLFLKLDMDEDEESFYVYENTGLTKQPCYHIYFNKSENMEDYVFGTGKKDRYRKPEVKNAETGKYGIILNNINKKKENVPEAVENTELKPQEISVQFGKMASFVRVAAAVMILTAVAGIGVLYKDGKLSGVQQSIEKFASGFINENDEKDIENIIAVNGVVETTASEENESTDVAGNTTDETETTTGEAESQSTEEITETAKTEPTETSIEAMNTYIVQEGDTLLSICIEYYQDKSMIDDVIAANGIENPDMVVPGEELIMP